MTQRRTFLTATAGTGLLAASGLAIGQAPVKAGFVYVSPIGDAGWTFQHDTGRKQMEQALAGKVQTQFIESVKEGPDAERVIREHTPLISLSDITEIELLILKRMREVTMGDHRSLAHGSGFDFVGLRDFQAGDRPAQIDWPQSTLTNFSPLIVREYEQPSTASVVVSSVRRSMRLVSQAVSGEPMHSTTAPKVMSSPAAWLSNCNPSLA